MQIFICFKSHKTISELFVQSQAQRAIDVPRVGTEAFLSGFCGCCPLPGLPEAHRTRAEWRGEQSSASQPAELPCCPGRCAGPRCSSQTQVQLPDPGAAPRRLTPAPAVPRGMGVAKKHLAVYKQLSRAGSDPPKGSGPGIVPFPGCCWEIQLGAAAAAEDTECWEGTEFYSWAHYSPAVSHAAKLCCRGWYCWVSNHCHSFPSTGAQLQGETR